MNELEQDILKILCRHNFDWCTCSIPYPSTVLSRDLNISLYKIRKALKTLKELGYIDSHRYCYIGEGHNQFMNGYLITDKVLGTPIYEQVKIQEENFIESLFSEG